MLKIVVIGEKDFALGFQLSGVKEVKEVNESNYVERFEKSMGEEGVGIIVMDDKYFKKLPQRVKKKIEKSITPVVIAMSETEVGASDLGALIKRCLGVDLWKE